MQPHPHVCLRRLPLPVAPARGHRGGTAEGTLLPAGFALRQRCQMFRKEPDRGAQMHAMPALGWRGTEPGSPVRAPGRFPARGVPSGRSRPWQRHPSAGLAAPAPVLGCVLPASRLPAPTAAAVQAGCESSLSIITLF